MLGKLSPETVKMLVNILIIAVIFIIVVSILASGGDPRNLLSGLQAFMSLVVGYFVSSLKFILR